MKSLVSFAACVVLAGCSSWVGHNDRFAYVVPLYRVEIVQGNVVTKEQAALVKPGMTREQVRGVLGSPLLTDPFHADRWDYLFTIRRQGTEPQLRKLVAHFKGDVLERFEVPDNLPTEHEFVASINTFHPKREAPKLALTEAERAALPKPVRPAPAAPEALGPTRSYPPLERE
jgi:outer membrane protein assembly factor BamE